ncbi:CAP domain-containing protein [Helicobacter sp. 23-1048]
MAKLYQLFFISLFFLNTHALAQSIQYDQQDLAGIINNYRFNANLPTLQNHKTLQRIADRVAYLLAYDNTILRQKSTIGALFKNIDLDISFYRVFATYGNMQTTDLTKHLVEKNSADIFSQKYDYLSIGLYEKNNMQYIVALLAKEIQDTQSEVQKVIALTNQARRANGIYNDVFYDEDLSRAALKRAKETVRLFDHKRPDGRNFYTVFEEFGIDYIVSGENLASGQADAYEVVNGWMNSPGHRANILTKDFDSIGVGLFFYQGQAYWTQLFTKQAQ